MENKTLGRIRRNSEFIHLKKTGRKLRPQSWIIFNFKKNELGHLRLGITLSRKVGTAVLRNKLKRWSREYARQFINKEFNPSYDLCVVFLPSKDSIFKQLQYKELKNEFDKVFQKFKSS